jgi:hypothetical protein
MADRFFYLGMALLIALIVVAGFGPTADVKVFHPPSPRPRILYVHMVVFTAWVLLFVVQAALVFSRRMAWHRRLGVSGIALGTLIPALGVTAAIVMKRLHIAEGHLGGESEMIVPFFDMLSFTVSFGLAIYWRTRPEFHRRLMLVASCALTVAAFARLPSWVVPPNTYYLGVDALILVAAARDWIVSRRVHPVYVYGLPALMLGQAMTMWIFLTAPAIWVAMVRPLLL